MKYEETPLKKVVKQLPKPPQNKQDKKDMTKEQYNKAKADHNAAISKLKADIKKHKLLKKQAKITYKLTKIKGDK